MIWKITLSSNETHTLTSPPKDYEDLVSLVQLKYNLKDSGYFSLRYIDADDEFITLSGEEDFDTAILSCSQEKLQALEIFVFPGTALMQQVQKDMAASITSSLKRDKIWTPYDKHHPMMMTKSGNSLNFKCKTNGPKETAQKSKRSSSCPLWNQDAAHDQEAKESKRKRSEFLARAVDKLEKQVQVEITEILPQMIGAIKNVFEPSKAKPARQQPQIGKSFAKDTLKEPVTVIADPIQDMIESLPSLSTKLERHQSHRPSTLQGITKESLKDAFPGSFTLTRRPRADTYIANCKDQANLISPPLFKNVSANPPSTYLTVRRNCLRKDSDDFKVFLSRTNPDEPINVEPMRCYKVAFELRNCGDVKLPEGVRLVCVNGINKGSEKMVPSLEPGRAITTELSLRAPKEKGKYLSQWKISYGKGDKQRSIGESVFEEICVGGSACNSPQNAQKESCQSPQEMGKALRSFSKPEPEELDEVPGITSLKRGQSTLVTGEDKVKCAKFLNEVFPGNFREKMNFVKEISKGVTISDAVERYLQMPRPTKY